MQALRGEDGIFVFEHRAGRPRKHFGTSLPDARQVTARMWRWLQGDPARDAGLDWRRVRV